MLRRLPPLLQSRRQPWRPPKRHGEPLTIYRIWPDLTGSLDANVELDDQAVILHSRGGATGGRPPRNTQYEAALDFLIRRLMRGPQWIRRILIDSAEAHRRAPSPADRVLLGREEIESASGPGEVVRLIRRRARDFGQPPGTKGGNSTKQIRIETDWGHPYLRAGLNLRAHRPTAAQGDSGPRLDRALTSEEQRRVTSTDIDSAVASLLAGEDAPNFAPSRDYDLLTAGGDRLAPKKVFGRALEIAGVVSDANPYHFSAGWSQPSFQLLQAAGYSIVPKAEAGAEAARRKRRAARSREEIDLAAASVGVDPEERSWIEGDVRMASHLRTERKRSAKAAAAKRALVRAAHDGRLACEHCTTDWYAVYPAAIAEAIFDVHHTIPLKDMDEGHETVVDDLLCLCANCHRAEHRRMAS